MMRNVISAEIKPASHAEISSKDSCALPVRKDIFSTNY